MFSSISLKCIASAICISFLAFRTGFDPPAASESAAPAATYEQAKAHGADNLRWACILRRAALTRLTQFLNIAIDRECVEDAFRQYQLGIDSAADSDSEKTEAAIRNLERSVEPLLVEDMEHDKGISAEELARIRTLRERRAKGEPLLDFSDPMYNRVMTARYLESRTILYAVERELRRAFVSNVLACAPRALGSRIGERFQARTTVDSSYLGEGARKYWIGLDPGLLTGFDLYGIIESQLAPQGGLASLDSSILSVGDLDPDHVPALVIAVHDAILSYDTECAIGVDAWVTQLVQLPSRVDFTTPTSERQQRSFDSSVGSIIRRRWQLVTAIAAILRAGGSEQAANRWMADVKLAMFPSLFAETVADRSARVLLGNYAGQGPLLHEIETAYAAFASDRDVLRTRIIETMILGAGVDGRRSIGAAQNIEKLMADASALESACIRDLNALTSGRNH